MSKLLSILLKIALLLLLSALVVLAGYWLHIRFEWTYLMLGGLFAGVLALCLIFYLGRRMYYRRREEHFIRSMVDKGAPSLQLQEEEGSLEELRKQWAKGIAILRKSRLRLSGNPIYSLPWFMVFGESGAGKSTAISHARLSAAASQAGPLAHVPHTRNCDWWFFEEAVVLDTAGRYALPVSPESDEREWEELLDLLAGARKREPLNGLVLAISAERLLRESGEDLRDYGRLVRMRLETMSRYLGARVPVYIMVTKMDQVLGMTELASLLSEEERRQALGLLNKDQDEATLEFLQRALAHVQGRLRDMGMVLAVRSGKQDGRSALFAREFSLLEPGLAMFVQGAFAASPYSETPMLRGLFFSSGRQEGCTEARSFQDLETFKNHKWRLPNTDSSLFLHNFFATILPRERGFMQFLDSYLSRITLTRNLGYLVWLCLCFALCCYFSVSFLENREELAELAQSYMPPPHESDSLQTTVVKLNAVVDAIQDFEEGISDNWWHYPGKAQTWRLLSFMQQKHVEWMRSKLFQQNEALLARTIAEQPPQNRRLTLAMLCEYIAWTREAMKAIDKGQAPPPPVADITADFFSQSGMSIALNDEFLNRVFMAYAKWEDPENRAVMEERGRQAIRRYMTLLGSDLSWLTDWLETRNLLDPIPLSRYWSQGDSAVEISRAFTKKGRERLEQMLASLQDAAEDQALFADRANVYKSQYASQFRSSWWDMAAKFSFGPGNFTTPEQWRAAATDMTSLANPYFSFIKDMSESFDAVADLGGQQDRDSLPKALVAVMNTYRANQDEAALSAKVGGAVQHGKEALQAAADHGRQERVSRTASAVTQFTEYMELLRKVFLASRTDGEAMLLASAGFAGGEQAAKTPVAQGLTTLGYLESSLDPKASENRVFWELVEGPLAFQTALAIYRSACQLNSLWKDNVLSFAREYDSGTRWHVLFDKDHGYVTDFLANSAKPFVHFNHGQWLASRWLGISFPLKNDFLSFLGMGQVDYAAPQEEYSVKFTSLPVNVNDMAEKPYRVRLALNCGQELQQLDNYNYPTGLTFKWKPAVCGDTTLEIFFNTLTLKKTWSGDWAFRSFLSEFEGGIMTITADEFPDHRDLLAELDVTAINVRYAIEGASAVLDLRHAPSIDAIPVEAAICRGDMAVNDGAGARLAPLPVMPASPKAAGGASGTGAPGSGGKTR